MESETYYILGDAQSVTFVIVSLVTWYHAIPAWPTIFDSNSTVRMENVIQYYRASSFALASLLYTHGFARTGLSNANDSTPLPDQMEHSEYQSCLERVVTNALPILNKPPGPGRSKRAHP